MKMKIRNLAWITLAALICLAGEPALGSIGIDGALFIAEGAPGDPVYHEMNISIPETETPNDISVKLSGFGQSLAGIGYPLEPENNTSPYSATSFLEVNLTEFHLEPGSSQKVIMAGRIPDDVGAGGRYALIDVRGSPPGGPGIGISVGIAVPVLLTIKDTELIHTGEIVEVNETKTDLGVDVSVIFKNTGNHHFKAKANAILEDSTGKVVAEAVTHPSLNSIIPPNSKEFEMHLEPEAELEPGTYNMKVAVTLNDGTVLADEEKSIEV
jgi:hypothetical protein